MKDKKLLYQDNLLACLGVELANKLNKYIILYANQQLSVGMRIGDLILPVVKIRIGETGNVIISKYYSKRRTIMMLKLDDHQSFNLENIVNLIRNYTTKLSRRHLDLKYYEDFMRGIYWIDKINRTSVTNHITTDNHIMIWVDNQDQATTLVTKLSLTYNKYIVASLYKPTEQDPGIIIIRRDQLETPKLQHELIEEILPDLKPFPITKFACITLMPIMILLLIITIMLFYAQILISAKTY